MEKSASSRRRFTSRSVLISDMCVLVPAGTWTVLFTREFKEIFASLDIPLPVITLMVLSVDPIIYAAAFVLTIAALIVKEFVIANKRVTLTINIIAAFVGFVWLVFFSTSLYLPFVKLMPS